MPVNGEKTKGAANGYHLLGSARPKPVDRKSRYRFLWRWVFIVTSLVALTPLFILTFMNYFQYQRALNQEVKERVNHITVSTKRSLEFFLDERRSALVFVAREKSFEELSDQDELASIFQNLQAVIGDIVDLGFIDSHGRQISYVGPYQLIGKDYSAQDWFHEVTVRGYYVSDVFLGYRRFPHFVIAVAKKGGNGKPYVLRATIDSEILDRQLRSLNLVKPSEAFIVSRQGTLQTPSSRYGSVLEQADIEMPPYSEGWAVQEKIDRESKHYMMGYAFIKQSPFILIVIKHSVTSMENWFTLRRNLWLVLFISSVVILLIILGASYYMVSRIQEADAARAQVLHKVEYQNKMASLGRLAAGVAHEINNPLAIINEKAGMIKDIFNLQGEFPEKERTLKLAESILKSVARCSRITRRLLGFAKHIDIKIETIEVDILLQEVIGFLEHEAKYRNVSIEFEQPDYALPAIQSDRGQLEQAFLNIINNSLNALSESGKDGKIKVMVRLEDPGSLAVIIEDNGPGISRENLKHIFEPFFTTRAEGTGLGLSITYGIIDKLGGQIDVQSELGSGTSFKVILPVQGG